MLHDFITANRAEIVARCRAMISSRPAPRPTDEELEFGVPLFLEQLARTLRSTLDANPEILQTATQHGLELLRRGFTVGQVVRDYGGICQVVTELAVEQEAAITPSEFKTLNLCLDDAIAGAVSEYGRMREHEGVERLGHFAHELRNLLSTASLAFHMLKSGSVGIGGSTGAVLDRSLASMRNLVDHELTEVRLAAGVPFRETIRVREFVEDVEVSAALDANERNLQFLVTSVSEEVEVRGDRQVLASVLTNLLQNAFKFTRAGGLVALRVRATAASVFMDVEDQCGGLPPGKAEELFLPFTQKGDDRTGVGLGLSICKQGVRLNGGEIHVVNHPGTGCVFTVSLPRQGTLPT